ncbi:MAG: orotate phosphoribosyltransferase [Cyclobacteriaceae bacterium]|nr:orotate phosphoribosyltransferase [Cyclobacteriaceae bacterium]MCH8516716.1 orotate phosphoribosyltransferase [Cyclobacteriaceae bacterium]
MITFYEELLKIEAVKLSPDQYFTWSSGWKSPIYCDNRLTLSYPMVREMIVERLSDKSREFGDFDIIAGVATAGIPHGALLASKLNKPFIYVRGKAKGHGLTNMIEGKISTGAKVLVVEDLISTGGSSIKAAEAIKQAGMEVSGILAIFTYGFQQASEAMKAAGIQCKTIGNYSELLKVAVDKNYIQAKDLEILEKWSQAPDTFGR